MQFALPKLAGKGVVDSAKMFDYACSHNTVFTDSIIVDHVNWGAAYADSASWGSQVLQANVGTLVRDTTTGWKTVNIRLQCRPTTRPSAPTLSIASSGCTRPCRPAMCGWSSPGGL